jgi:3-dehydroquinate synthetase
MMAASIVSHKKNFLKNQELKAIKDLYQKLDLNDSFKSYIRNNQLNNFFKIMKKDKKNNSKNINLILLKKIGKAFIYKTTLEKTLIPFVKSELKNA